MTKLSLNIFLKQSRSPFSQSGVESKFKGKVTQSLLHKTFINPQKVNIGWV